MDYASSSASGQQQEQERARIESKFRVLWEKQTYVNLLYLLVSFPLGIFYFVFLLLGLSSILSTTVILGAPILLLVIFIWWRLARFERHLAMRWLHVEISPMALLLEVIPGHITDQYIDRIHASSKIWP